MVESLNSLKAHFETTPNTGTPLKAKYLDVKWMRNGLANFASISFNEKLPSILDEKSLEAFLRLLKQRSGSASDTLLVTLEDASSVDASRKESNTRRVPVEDGMEIDSSTGVAKGSHTSPNCEPRPRRLTIVGSNIAPGQASDTTGDGNNSNPMAGGSSLADANRGQLVILPPR